MIRRLMAARSVLLIVDMQASLMPVIEQGQARIDAAYRLAQAAKLLDVPVMATEHVADKIGHTVPPLRACITTVCDKTHFDGTKEPTFERLMPVGRSQVVVVGAEAHVCVMQTALGVLQSGREVWVAADGCGARHEEDRTLGLARLERSGAQMVSSEMVMFEWLAQAAHPKFREVLEVIKSKDQ